jgi:hypothetical protein
LLPVAADGHGGRVIEGIGAPVARGVDAGPQSWIMLRPERLRLLDVDQRADVEFEAICFNTYLLGSRTHMHLRRDERTFIVELSPDLALPEPGATVRVGFDWSDAVSVAGEAAA